MNTAAHLPARENWPLALLHVDRHALLTYAETVRTSCEVSDADLPRSGQHPLVLRDSVADTPFQLGDMPLTSAAVRVEYNGQAWHGATLIARCDAALAQAIAIVDAVLAADVELPGAGAAAELVRCGEAQCDVKCVDEHRLLAATAVRFDLLGEARQEPSVEKESNA